MCQCQPSALFFFFLFFLPRYLARSERCWKSMRTVTYGWRSVARRGHLTQPASQPSLWRWMPTSWRPRIPTNLEVSPLPGRGGFISNAAAPALPPSSTRSSSSLPLFLLCLCYACFHIQTATVAFMITAMPWLRLCFFFQQCVYLVLCFLNVPLYSMSQSCMLTARGFGSKADICHYVRRSHRHLD